MQANLTNIIVHWKISEGLVKYIRKRRANQFVDQWSNKWETRLPHIVDKKIANTFY